jgi:hypothetical protein
MSEQLERPAKETYPRSSWRPGDLLSTSGALAWNLFIRGTKGKDHVGTVRTHNVAAGATYRTFDEESRSGFQCDLVHSEHPPLQAEQSIGPNVGGRNLRK